jgi:hypothetical protein
MAVHLTAVTAVAAARDRLAAVNRSRLAAAVVVAMAAVAAIAAVATLEHTAEQPTAMATMAAVSTAMATIATVAAMTRDGTVVSAQQGDANHREEDRDAKNQSSIHLGSSKLSKPTRVRNSKTQKHTGRRSLRPPSSQPSGHGTREGSMSIAALADSVCRRRLPCLVSFCRLRNLK